MIGTEGRKGVVRIPRSAFGTIDPPSVRSVVARSMAGTVDIYVSPGLRRLIEEPDSVAADGRALAGAALLAASRGQYVWDVDVGIALGADPTEEGVARWRANNRLPRPPAAWPDGWSPSADLVGAARELALARSSPGSLASDPSAPASDGDPEVAEASNVGIAVGDEVDGYLIQQELGRGGMGVVFLAFDALLNMPVALKIIAPHLASDEVIRQRFIREARIAASLRHPHTLNIYKVGEARGTLYVCMRYVDGPSLHEVIQRVPFLEAQRATMLIRQVAGALDEAHDRGFVHRDVKPQNILLATVGNDEYAYLTDFGLARVVADTGFTRTGDPLGTPSYMAPEQVLGRHVGPAADVYSLGCVLYECLTGRRPFERENSQAILFAHAHEPPPAATEGNTALPHAIDPVIARALAKDPAERFESAGAFAEAAEVALIVRH